MNTPSPLPKITPASPPENYLQKEADKLNSEVEKLLEETRSREKYSLTIIAAVAGWVFTHLSKADANPGLLKAISAIPLCTTLIYGISVMFLYKNIRWIGKYLKRIENHFFKGVYDGQGTRWGWERHFDASNKKSKFVKVTRGNWILQVILAAALFVLVCYNAGVPAASNTAQTKAAQEHADR